MLHVHLFRNYLRLFVICWSFCKPYLHFFLISTLTHLYFMFTKKADLQIYIYIFSEQNFIRRFLLFHWYIHMDTEIYIDYNIYCEVQVKNIKPNTIYKVSHETWQLINSFECRLPYTVLDIKGSLQFFSFKKSFALVYFTLKIILL